MTLEELKAYLIKEAGHSKEMVDSMDGYDLLDAYLRWNGLFGLIFLNQ